MISKEIRKAARIAAPVFAYKGWKWGNGEDYCVPDEKAIAETLTTLAVLDYGQFRSTGRLAAFRTENDTFLCLVIGQVAS